MTTFVALIAGTFTVGTFLLLGAIVRTEYAVQRYQAGQENRS